MSNLGNKLKAGFYAMPLSQGKYVKELIKVPEGTECSWLDPTCGEGEILAYLAKGHPGVQLYGVEIDKGRAMKAQQVLHHCINAPIESMVISNFAFSLLWLNPPYDFLLKSFDEEKASRKELEELQRNVRYLQDGGILIYVIPSYRFSDNRIARFLSIHFEHVAIARFTDENDDYAQYKQAVFIGRKKAGAVKGFNEKLFDFLLKMESDRFTKEHVTPLDMIVGKREWVVPPGPTVIKTFYSRLERKSDYYKGILTSTGFEALKNRTKRRSLTIGGNPIMPINNGQRALLLAAGAINGYLGQGDTLHLVQGMEDVFTKTHEEIITSDSGHTSKKTVHTTIREISVKTITPSGKITKLVGAKKSEHVEEQSV